MTIILPHRSDNNTDDYNNDDYDTPRLHFASWKGKGLHCGKERELRLDNSKVSEILTCKMFHGFRSAEWCKPVHVREKLILPRNKRQIPQRTLGESERSSAATCRSGGS